MRCIYNSCKNNNKKSSCIGEKTQKVKFFRLPKDETRCTQWLEASGRGDLLKPNFDFRHSYETLRICSDHFDSDMYNNPFEKTKLLCSAVPKTFVSSSVSTNLFSNLQHRLDPEQNQGSSLNHMGVLEDIITFIRCKIKNN